MTDSRRKMETGELEDQKKRLTEAIRTQQHTKEAYEATSAQLLQVIHDFRSLELEDVLRGKEIQALKSQLQREKAAKGMKLERVERLEKQLQAQEEAITRLELMLTSVKLEESTRKEGDNVRSYGSTAATTLQASGWKQVSTEDLKLREMEERLSSLEREAEKQSEVTQQLQLGLFQLLPCKPQGASAPTSAKRKRCKGCKWTRSCAACASKLNCAYKS